MTFLPDSALDLLRPVIAGIMAYGAIIFLTRLSGQRMFSKIWAFDFAVTVSIGSLLAAITLNKSVALASGLIALGTVFTLQIIVTRLRTSQLMAASANPPILLMDGPSFVDENLKKAKVTRKDVISELRQKGVTHLSQIQAVVMESNGEISVLQGNEPPDPALFEGITRK